MMMMSKIASTLPGRRAAQRRPYQSAKTTTPIVNCADAASVAMHPELLLIEVLEVEDAGELDSLPKNSAALLAAGVGVAGAGTVVKVPTAHGEKIIFFDTPTDPAATWCRCDCLPGCGMSLAHGLTNHQATTSSRRWVGEWVSVN